MMKLLYKWKSWWRSLRKFNYSVIKLGFSIFFVGFAFRLIYSQSAGFSKFPYVKYSHISPPHVDSFTPQQITVETSPQEDIAGKCNLFIGDWIPNQGGPLYTNETCSFIADHQNCMKNGRQDTGYLYWRWNPRGCELPRLNPWRFLELMRNKSWAFIGDSISRNHVQSLLCILSTVEKAVEVDHDEGFKSRRWLFPSYNVSVAGIWSPFIAEAAIFDDIVTGASTSEIELHLDKLDTNWTKLFKSWDYVIFSFGKWFIRSSIYYEKNTGLGCHYCPKRNLTELGIDFAYQKVLRNLIDYIVTSNHKGTIFYRTSAPDHFENGEWDKGGHCRRTEPAGEGEFDLPWLNKIFREIELEEFHRASTRASNRVNLKLLDVTPLSLLRPDGHPGPYKFFQPFSQDKNGKIINDCLHWCLPGPIDSWNDLLMEMVING
ncbi:trichome birefringence-like 23 [Olea europaea subsp. europaea]|uniref:Trichome birefringence-like 23 n=1 Tax=Olea europaea subsp. europaea TaxID=158383 RepID=A0A8S0TX79_OLEEU|nr:trichome birefringence-like 23 [Olea europaea subsp. europaea]